MKVGNERETHFLKGNEGRGTPREKVSREKKKTTMYENGERRFFCPFLSVLESSAYLDSNKKSFKLYFNSRLRV